MQLVMILLFCAVWGLDTFSFFLSSHSTVVGYVPLLARAPLVIASLGLGLFLMTESHKAVFGEKHDPSRLVDSSVYSWVRHPMYIGTLLLCLSFFFAVPSLLSLAVWIAFFLLYDRMATYEEKDLIRRLGEEYTVYKKRVPKWFPKLTHRA